MVSSPSFFCRVVRSGIFSFSEGQENFFIQFFLGKQAHSFCSFGLRVGL